MNREHLVVFWFRRDLRIQDNHGLHQALTSGLPVLPVFIFDTEILSQLEDKKDKRVAYIHQHLEQINQAFGKKLKVLHTTPKEAFETLTKTYTIQAVYCNEDYEPQAIKRDTEIAQFLSSKDIVFHSFKDQVLFEKKDLLKSDQTPYTIYTPYSKLWKLQMAAQGIPNYPSENFLDAVLGQPQPPIPTLEELGFESVNHNLPQPQLQEEIIATYGLYRDFPAMDHTTRLGVALRFGTISVRACIVFANQHNQVWLSELIWREFFMQILYHFPRVVHQCFKTKYEGIQWRNNEAEFEIWCRGNTGVPIVDAGMRELNTTGFMHNRVRMIVASYLCKHLLIDWRWGEAYFAQKLLDYDLSANNGNWQWAAGTGCDAAPYFRIFNPTAQTLKFDKNQEYIKKWVPEYQDLDYPQPMVDHQMARLRALEVYKSGINP
ncbi:MAG: deoxyribodipyrimidine photo-lyase [Flavobacterium sp.]|nr:deoxyribodipyrimidine photo-lyase [Candidatus Neoflavobacterium equi]